MPGTGRIVSQATSLCLCVSPYTTASPNLLRLMDVVGDRIVPADINPDKPKRFDNRDAFFYGKIALAPGDIAVFDWSTEESANNADSDYTTISIDSEAIPIELIPVRGVNSPEDLVEKLRAGVPATPKAENRHILFTFESNKFLHCGILIPKGALERLDNGMVRVVNSLSTARVYQLPTSKVTEVSIPAFFANNQNFPNSITFCKVFDIGTEDDVICLHSPVDLVKRIVLSRASWTRYSKLVGGTHAEHDAMKNFISLVGEDSLVQEIMRCASVNEATAMQFLREFEQKAADSIHVNEIDRETIESIVTSSETLHNECVEYGKKLWLEKNQGLIKEAEDKVAASQAEVDALETQKLTLQKETQEASLRLKRLSDESKEKQAAVKNIPAMLRKYLTSGNSEFYRLMTERTLGGIGGGLVRPSEDLSCQRVKGGTYTEALGCLAARLEALGFKTADAAKEYAALLLACFYQNETCILMGSAASEVVRSLCAVISNQSQDILECSGSWDPTLWEVALGGEGKALEIRGAFDEDWFDRMAFDMMTHKKACFVTVPYVIENISDMVNENLFPVLILDDELPVPVWNAAAPQTAAAEDGTLTMVSHKEGEGRGKFNDSGKPAVNRLLPIADSISATHLSFSSINRKIASGGTPQNSNGASSGSPSVKAKFVQPPNKKR